MTEDEALAWRRVSAEAARVRIRADELNGRPAPQWALDRIAYYERSVRERDARRAAARAERETSA
jgi:hypothetical protein